MAGEDGNLTDAELAELAAFADGSLPADRRQAVAERVERSPELSAMVAEQRAALEAVGALDVRAPADLHARVGSREAPASTRRRFGGLALAGGALAVVAAAALLAIVVVGAGDDPTIPQAAELASRGAESGAPEAGSPKLLAASVGGVSFPDYAEAFGLRASGARADSIDGREAETVFYTGDGSELAYTIVAGEQLAWPQSSRVVEREGVELRVFDSDGEPGVTWLRGGHTCVLTGSGVSEDELLELAAWQGEGAVQF